MTTTQTAKASEPNYDEEFARYNAKHPAAPMPLTTPALDAAAADRLTTLLTARESLRSVQSLLQEMNTDGTPQQRLLRLELCAGVILALRHKPRRKARMQALFNGLDVPPLTPEARTDCKRAGRACRLLRRLLLTGCQKRGEC